MTDKQEAYAPIPSLMDGTDGKTAQEALPILIANTERLFGKGMTAQQMLNNIERSLL